MSEAEEKPYTFRSYREDDIPFIHSSWGNSFYKGNESNFIFSAYDFHEILHRPVRESLFTRPSATIIVCVSKESEDLIIGWVAFEKIPNSDGPTIHYIYVKEAFKNEGIAKEMLNLFLKETTIYYTHQTRKLRKLLSQERIKSEQEQRPNVYEKYQYKPTFARGEANDFDRSSRNPLSMPHRSRYPRTTSKERF